MAWIRTIDWGDATGELKEAYDWQAASLGEPAEFTRVGSLFPGIVAERLSLYRTVERCPSSLSPIERQLACYVTSLCNGTAHCASGLRLKLVSLEIDPAALRSVEEDPRSPDLDDPRLRAICHHAAKLTVAPTEMVESDIDELRAHGLDDLDLLDLNNLVAYYNYINRVVNGLGIRSVMETEHEATRAVPVDERPAS